MRIYLTILVMLFWSCSNTDKYELFDLDSLTNYQLISLDTINDIETFNSRFWYMDSLNDEMSFVARFDFKKGEFNNKSTKGIKLEGLPYLCLIYDCIERNTLRLYLDEDYQIRDNENNLLSENQTKILIKSNILNYGKDPSLSDTPKDAIISIFLTPNQRIDRVGKFLQHIVDGYLEILQAKKIETGKPIVEIIEEFPLKIQLRKLHPELLNIPHNMNMQIESEIQEDIELDTTKF